MSRTTRWWPLLWLLVLAAAAVWVYGPGLRIGYYSDDFAYYTDPPVTDPLYYFHHDNPGTAMYRPLQAAFLDIVRSVWGLQTQPIHLVTLACHILLSWLVALGVLRLGHEWAEAIIASLFMLLAQIHTYAVLGNDTLSQVAGVLFGCIAAWLLYFPARANSGGDHRVSPGRALLFGTSLLGFAISLSFKETGTAYLGIIGIALLAANLERLPRRDALIRTVVQIVPFIVLAAVYMIVRSQFVNKPIVFGDGRYDLNLGLNIPRNIALLLAASSTAVSSVKTVVAFQQKDLPMIAMVLATSLLFAGLVIAGLIPLRHDRRIQVLCALYFTGFLPAILLNRVSEHYIYNSFPFLAALVGIGIGRLWRLSTSRGAHRALTAALLSILLLHFLSIRSKTAMMQANGERAAVFLEQLRPIVQTAPPRGTVHLLNPPNDDIEYSIYAMNDFDVLEAGFPGVQSYLGRGDLTMDIRYPSDIAAGLHGNDSTMIVTLEKGRIVRYEGADGEHGTKETGVRIDAPIAPDHYRIR